MRLWKKLKEYRESRGLPWFSKPWDLNLFVLRDGVVGNWRDTVLCTCVDDAGRRVVLRTKCTSDASLHEWTNPTHPDGCIYVLDQHVPGGLVLGEFKGRHALRQKEDFLYVRWPKSKGYVPKVSELEVLAVDHSFSANRGTHLHNRRDGSAPAKPIPDDSEGCTVNLYRHEHAALIEMVKQQRRFHGSAVVSPTYLKKSLVIPSC